MTGSSRNSEVAAKLLLVPTPAARQSSGARGAGVSTNYLQLVDLTELAQDLTAQIAVLESSLLSFWRSTNGREALRLMNGPCGSEKLVMMLFDESGNLLSLDAYLTVLKVLKGGDPTTAGQLAKLWHLLEGIGTVLEQLYELRCQRNASNLSRKAG